MTRKIRLRQIRCFVTVARKKSFVLAADDLGLTQPAVSRSVRELEHILGHELFDRSQRGAHLTVRGRTLLAAAELGLMQIAQGVQDATETGWSSEIIRVGALPNVCSQFLPGVVQEFKSEFSDIVMRIVPGTNLGLLDGLRRGETDIVLGRLASSEDMRGLVFEALYDEPLIFVVGKQHPLVKSNAGLEDALSYPLLLPPEGTIIRQEATRFLSSQGVGKLPNVIETTSSDFQKSYLRLTDCVAIVPRGVVRLDLDEGGIVQLPIGDISLMGPTGMTRNPEASQSQSLQHLLHLLRERATLYHV